MNLKNKKCYKQLILVKKNCKIYLKKNLLNFN